MGLRDGDLVIDEEVDNTEEKEIIEKSEISDEVETDTENVQVEEDEEDRIVMIGDAVPEDSEEEENKETEEGEKKPKESSTLNTVRKVNRKQEAEIKRLKKQIEANQAKTEIEQPVELGKEPTLADSKYDEVKFKQEVIAYDARKRKVEEQAAKKAKTVEDQNNEYAGKQKNYTDKKKEYGFKDFSEAEELVVNTLSVIQQDILVDGMNDAALVVYALGKNPKKLEALSKITNNIVYAVELGKLEAQLKIKTSKVPKPERQVKSGGSGGGADNTLDRLEAEADKTGDRTKVSAYKRKLRNKDK